MNNDPKRVVTGEVRLSYVHLFQPYAKNPNDEPKYSTTMLIPKNDTATKQRIDAAIQAAIQEGVASKWNGVKPPMIPLPLHDGDGVRPSDGMPFPEECKGHWVMTASTKQQPQVVDLNVQPIINQTEVYSGMYARVSIRFFPYNANGKKGIGCGLGNVQKVRDGEPLGGRTSAADDFGSFAPAPQQTQQQFQQPQMQPQNQQQTYQPQQQFQQPQIQPQNQQQYQPQPQQYQAIDPITGMPIV